MEYMNNITEEKNIENSIRNRYGNNSIMGTQKVTVTEKGEEIKPLITAAQFLNRMYEVEDE